MRLGVMVSLTDKYLFAQNWGKIFRRWKSGHLQGYRLRVTWDHLLAFKAEIIQ